MSGSTGRPGPGTRSEGRDLDGGRWRVCPKPRPALIIQDDRFRDVGSLTVMPLMQPLSDAPLLRIPAEPSARTGRKAPSQHLQAKLESFAVCPGGRLVSGMARSDLTGAGRRLMLDIAPPELLRRQLMKPRSPHGRHTPRDRCL